MSIDDSRTPLLLSGLWRPGSALGRPQTLF